MDIDAQTDGILPGAFHEGLLAAARALSSTKGNENAGRAISIGKKGNMARRCMVRHGFMASLTSIQVDYAPETAALLETIPFCECKKDKRLSCFSKPSLTTVSPFWGAIPRPNSLQQLLFEDAILWDGCLIPCPSITAT